MATGRLVSLALALACGRLVSAEAPPPPSPALVESDIRMIAGGNFTPDSVGPGPYNETLRRAHAHPAEYLAAFEALYLKPEIDLRVLSDLYLPSFLEEMSKVDAPRARTLARRLLDRYDAVLFLADAVRNRSALVALLPPKAARVLDRLTSRRAQLRALLER